MTSRSSTLIAFVPVLHKGYVDLFKKHGGVLYILGSDIIKSYTSLTRDLRVVDPRLMQKAIEALQIFDEVKILRKVNIKTVARPTNRLTMPDEDVARDLAKKYFSKNKVIFESIFLRWDKPITLHEHKVSPHRIISRATFDRSVIKQTIEEAKKSSDWWRQIGALAIRGKKIIAVSHNHHLPTDFHLAQNGDPRSNFDAGEQPEIYTSVHGEASLVARAAREGLVLKGTSLYTTFFPCANCSRLIGEAGITKVFYARGYSRLDGEAILNYFGVEIILVQ